MVEMCLEKQKNWKLLFKAEIIDTFSDTCFSF